MRLVVLVPWRPEPSRMGPWYLVSQHLEQLGLPLVVADSDTAVFSIGRAFNAAAVQAGNWDRAVFSEADAWVALDQMRAGLEVGGFVYCYDSHLKLTLAETGEYLAIGRLPDREAAAASSFYGSNGIRVIDRELWEQAGGYDPEFIGWGAEDNDMAYRMRRLVEPTRIRGVMYEMEHHRDDEYWEARHANRTLLRKKHIE